MQLCKLQTHIPVDCMTDILHIEDHAGRICCQRHPHPAGVSLLIGIPFEGEKAQTLFRCLESGTLSGLHIGYMAEYARTHKDISNAFIDNRLQGDDMDTLRHAAQKKDGRFPKITPKMKRHLLSLIEVFAHKWSGLNVTVSFNVCYSNQGKVEDFNTPNWGFNTLSCTSTWLKDKTRVPQYSFHKLFLKGVCSPCSHVQVLRTENIIPSQNNWSCFHHRSHVLGCLPTLARRLTDASKYTTRHYQAVDAGPKTIALNGHTEVEVLDACEANDAYADGKERKRNKKRCDAGLSRGPGSMPSFDMAAFEAAATNVDDHSPPHAISMPFWRIFEESLLNDGVIRIIDEHSLYLRVLMNDVNIDSGEPVRKKFVQVECALNESGDIVGSQCECSFYKDSWMIDHDQMPTSNSISQSDMWCPHTKLLPDVVHRSSAVHTDRNQQVNAALSRSSGVLVIDKKDFSRTYLVVVPGEQCAGYDAERGQPAMVYLQLVRGDIWYASCDRIECKVKKVKTESRTSKITLQCPHLKAVLHDSAVISDLSKSFPEYVGGCTFGAVQTKATDPEEATEGLSDDEVPSDVEDETEFIDTPARKDPFLCVKYNLNTRKYDPTTAFGQAKIPLLPTPDMRYWSEYRLRGDNIRRNPSDNSFFVDKEGFLISTIQHVPHTDVTTCKNCPGDAALNVQPDGVFILRSYIGSVKMYVFKLTCHIPGMPYIPAFISFFIHVWISLCLRACIMLQIVTLKSNGIRYRNVSTQSTTDVKEVTYTHLMSSL